jgi:hypothetical protein
MPAFRLASFCSLARMGHGEHYQSIVLCRVGLAATETSIATFKGKVWIAQIRLKNFTID